MYYRHLPVVYYIDKPGTSQIACKNITWLLLEINKLIKSRVEWKGDNYVPSPYILNQSELSNSQRSHDQVLGIPVWEVENSKIIHSQKVIEDK